MSGVKFYVYFFGRTGGLIFRQRFVVSNRNGKDKLGRVNWINSRSTPVGDAALYAGVPRGGSVRRGCRSWARVG